jgi:hypothetical protein
MITSKAASRQLSQRSRSPVHHPGNGEAFGPVMINEQPNPTTRSYIMNNDPRMIEASESDFAYGKMLALGGMPWNEVRKDQPENFANEHCRNGFRAGWTEGVAEGLFWKGEIFREPNAMLGEISMKFFVDQSGGHTVNAQLDVIADVTREEGDMLIRVFTAIINKYVAEADADVNV